MSTQTRSLRTLARLGLLAASFAAVTGVATPRGASAQARPRPGAGQSAGTQSRGVVNINSATAQELALLPGIGAAKAQAIIATRGRRRFRRVEDILRVRGIGRATFRRLRPMLRVDGQTTLQAAPSQRHAVTSD